MPKNFLTMPMYVKLDIKYNCSHSIQNRQGGLNWFLTLLNVIYKWRCQTWTKEIWFGCIWMWPPTRINCEIWFATETCFQANLKWFCIELPFAHKSQLKNHHTCTFLHTYVHILLTCKYFRNKILATASSDNLPGLPPPILQSFQLSSVFSFFSKIRCHHRKVCILWPMIIDPSSLAVLNFIIIIDHSEIVVVVERLVGGGVRFCQREWQWAGTYVRWLRRRITLFL